MLGFIVVVVLDNIVITSGAEGGADTDQRSKGGVPAAATVETEDKLIEVGLEMRLLQAVVDIQSPAFEVREQAGATSARRCSGKPGNWAPVGDVWLNPDRDIDGPKIRDAA